MTDKEAFYAKLKDSLEDTTNFPGDYLYKFIVPTTGDQEKEVEAIFKETAATYDTKFSKTGKYVSVSIELVVQSADQVIEFYRKAEKIEGIISL